VKPNAGLIAITEKRLPRYFSPQPTPIFTGGQRFVNKPGGQKSQNQEINEVEKIWHGNPFPNSKSEFRNPKQIKNSKTKNQNKDKCSLGHWDFGV
jgi:hypothetical protein